MNSLNERIDDLKMKRMLHCLNYLEWAMLQGRLPFCKWASIDKDVRFMIWRLRGENTPREREERV